MLKLTLVPTGQSPAKTLAIGSFLRHLSRIKPFKNAYFGEFLSINDVLVFPEIDAM